MTVNTRPKLLRGINYKLKHLFRNIAFFKRICNMSSSRKALSLFLFKRTWLNPCLRRADISCRILYEYLGLCVYRWQDVYR